MPPAEAGLREGDILRHYDGKELTSLTHFHYLRGKEGKGGPPRKLELLRKSKMLTSRASRWR